MPPKRMHPYGMALSCLQVGKWEMTTIMLPYAAIIMDADADVLDNQHRDTF